MMIDQALAEKLALSCNVLAMEGQNDVNLGHVTARLPGSDLIHMKPTGLGFEEVRGEDIILIDLEGNKVAGERGRHKEHPIHTEIYRARPEINCVVHTHPPYATVLGAVGEKVRPISREGLLFMDAPLFTETTELIVTKDQGQAVASALAGARAVLLQNHGVVVVGESIAEATVLAILLEEAARLQWLARNMGDYVWTSEEEAQRKIKQIYYPESIVGFWEYYVRKLNRTAK